MGRVDLFNSDRSKDKLSIFKDFKSRNVQKDLEIWDIEELTDKTNSRMLKLINNDSNVDCSKDYHTQGYMDNLPSLNTNQVNNALDIYGDLLAVARQRLLGMVTNYYNFIDELEFRDNYIDISYRYIKGGHLRRYNLSFYNDGSISVLDDNLRKVYTIRNYNEIYSSGLLNKVEDEFGVIINKFYLIWTYTIDRLKVKAYLLAMNDLNVNTYKDYLRQ